MNIIINPSILSANFCNLEGDFKKLDKAGIKSVHLDVMDGSFVPNITFGPGQIKQLRKLTDMKFDTHLMVSEPDRFIEDFAKAGSDSITVHAEACTHLHRTIQNIKSYNIEAAVALNPATPVENIKYVLDIIDKVLIMTVNPGFGGQKFIPIMEEKIKDLKDLINKSGRNIKIQVDGGINPENIKGIANLGVEDIVIGSALFKGENIEENIKNFNDILSK